MITAIEIENFKGIGKRQRIELRPLTLLFGPNSAGKSTVLHALHYAREIFDSRNLDADHTAIGGPFVDLGGFQNFVHNRDLTSPLSLAFEMEWGLLGPLNFIQQYSHWLDSRQLPAPLARRVGAFRQGRVEVCLKWSPYRQRPIVTAYAVWINGLPVATIRDDLDKPSQRITSLNLQHPVFAPDDNGDLPGGADAVAAVWSAAPKWIPEDENSRALPFYGNGALPDWENPFDFAEPDEDDAGDPQASAAREMASALLSLLLTGTGRALRDELMSVRYLGPLRETPPRDFTPPHSPDPGRWATGLAAWDVLHTGREDILAEVNEWLAGEHRLATGYRLVRQQVAQLDLASPLAVSLQGPRAFDEIEDLAAQIRALPCQTTVKLVDASSIGPALEAEDVGEGISQIIPVVVAAVAQRDARLLAEQPELHVHPRIQVALGDLFIQRSLPRSVPHQSGGFISAAVGPALIETHSEHLILRILRRIRETADGTLPAGLPPVKPGDVAVLYVQPGPEGTEIARLGIDETGEFTDRWPGGFFEERAEELFS